ncbi:hypothetical protein AXE65_06240 [Ventosimonas gracilis]|uniref:Conjugal transfer protein TraJ n=1 Tax=Ventosimonas gracilis TaxID=1680762 RepID=A0A139SM25_9GAMM|nr:conjugal transfer transcriptional regulator TraJ [Ventosimonas gracilis]KXU35626.1 hypothetical protein AXE65_06240 [Ventosimonas gracilis]
MTPREETDNASSVNAIRAKRRKHLRVPVLDDEAAIIEANAKQAGMSTARYLREVAMGYPLHSVMDKKAVLELVRINSDLARLGNLQKLWLDNDARTARFGTDQINRLLHRIEGTLAELRKLIKLVSAGKGLTA